MNNIIRGFLNDLTADELIELKEFINKTLKEKFKEDLGKRASKRAKVKIPATCVIEREKEFFTKEHPITIVEMSINGLVFRTTTVIYEDDIFNVSFRSPSTGEKKYIDCLTLRMKELSNKNGRELEIVAKAITQEEVKAYRDHLKNRSS